VRIRLVGIIAITAMLGGACGSDGSGSGSSNTQHPTTTITNPAVNAADQALAQQLVLSLSDFPPGWTSAPHSESKNDKAQKQLNACLHVPGTNLISRAVNAHSPDFTSPDQAEVQNTVNVAPSATKVSSALDVLASAAAPSCLSEYFNTALNSPGSPKDTKFGTATVNPLPSEPLGDRTVALRAAIPLSSKGTNVTVYADFFVVQKGRVAVVLIGLDEPNPFPTETATQLIQKVLGKIPASTG